MILTPKKKKEYNKLLHNNFSNFDVEQKEEVQAYESLLSCTIWRCEFQNWGSNDSW